ncbi:MAG: hypothetical protein MJZ38_07300 [archaeon]|nr:hypothetical protein [archaeon]
MTQYGKREMEHLGLENDLLGGGRIADSMSTCGQDRAMVRKWSLVLLGSVLTFIVLLSTYL